MESTSSCSGSSRSKRHGHVAGRNNTCETCGRAFRNKKELTKHRFRVHGISIARPRSFKFACSYCAKRFGTKQQRRVHEAGVHRKEKPHSCTECDASFTQPTHLRIHKRIHTGEKPYACTYCAKSFTKKEDRDLHIRVHTGEKPYACDECHARFSRQNRLKIHKIGAHVEPNTAISQPVPCPKCDKLYKSKDSLRSHLKTHEEKSFQCETCAKKFLREYDLASHSRRHTGETPFSCSFCSTSFSFKRSLESHIASHTGEKPFQCKTCGRKSQPISGLAKHRLTHRHRNQPRAIFTCTVCSKSYTTRHSLKVHNDRHHD